MARASGAIRSSVDKKVAARDARSSPTLTIGTISQSSDSAASSPPRPYAMPPHSSTGAERGSRPWITSQTKDPITPTRRRLTVRTGSVAELTLAGEDHRDVVFVGG